MAAPIGWVGLIVGGVAVAAAFSLVANGFIKDNVGDVYDAVISRINSR